MIRLLDACKHYRSKAGKRVVLDHVNAEFPTGRSVGILGLNGAGKSTLVRILGDAEPLNSGRIERTVRVSWPMGYTGGFQGNLSGRENARFVARIYGEDPHYVEEFTREFSELGRYFESPLKNYSAGMRGRFAFSVSLACNFECYLVDEAMETGDARHKEKFRRAFEERRENASLILVSHNEMMIRRNCDMAAILQSGKLEMFDDVKEAIHRYKYLQTQVA